MVSSVTQVLLASILVRCPDTGKVISSGMALCLSPVASVTSTGILVSISSSMAKQMKVML